MAGPLSAALDQLDEQMSARPFDAGAVRFAFYGVNKAIGATPDTDDLRRLFAACHFAMDLGAVRRPAIDNTDHQRSLEWSVEACLRTVIVDEQNRNRHFVQKSVSRHLGIGRAPYDGEPTEPLPLMHIALSEVEARDLIAPYLQHLEAGMAENPFAHLRLCWDVFDNPVPPFHTIFDQWLADLDRRRGTQELQAIRRAMALARLAEEGRQRLSWPQCERYLIPQLGDPHPLVAAAAARFLGALFLDPDEMIGSADTPSVAQIMARIAALPVHRRFVAGGFLNGFDALAPFTALREEAALEGVDIEGWVLAVLEDRTAEPYLPSAQSFWFYVHEAFCCDPAFIHRMIDAGHLWEALMTATEMQQEVQGMRSVLERLASCSEPGIATSAALCLDRHYPAQE